MPRSQSPPSRQWMLAGAALAVAVGVGFTAAKLTSAGPTKPAAENGEKEEKSAKGGADTVVMNDARIAASGLGVQTITSGGLAAEISAQASVAAAPGAQAVLTARAPGSVAQIYKRLGDAVRAGEVLALVESREASQIAAARSVAVAKSDLARKVLAREQHLYDQKVTPRQDLEAAQAELAEAEAEARSASAAVGAADVSRDGRYVRVVSPISGRITVASASLGAFVQPETELFRIANARDLQIEAAVTAAEARRIQPGDTAVLETSEGATATAIVRSVTPTVDPTTRAATVVLAMTGPQGLLQPGQLVRARIATRQGGGGGVVVPEDALQTWEGHDVIFVRTKDGFAARPVTVASRSGGRAEISAGVRPGDVIAVKNAFLLKAELGKGAADED